MKNKPVIVMLLFLFLLGQTVSAKDIAGPVQPVRGAGGYNYSHQDISLWEKGVAEEQYFIFEPAKPTPKKAGVVVFLHDWLTSSPEYYMAWIRHLCKKGWIVFFPRYQGQGELEETWVFNVVRSCKDFFMENFKRNGIEIDKEKFAVFGHGAGAILGANVAAVDSYFGLPRTKALLLVTPHRKSLKLFDLSSISKFARMVVLTGDRVLEENENTAREIFYAADRIKTGNKIYITVYSDYYGEPPLVADEKAALAPESPVYERYVAANSNVFINLSKDKFHAPAVRSQPIDAFDYFATLRLGDALLKKAFNEDSELEIFHDNSTLRFMGYWSDGKKLRGMIAGDRP
ncbi:MAG: alpha/beta hydrolase family protein [Candidatus Rifleibacteriota bacterium]